ncbi:MAG: hypothetical protein AAB757_01700 [Patescibacteria group bacterium]
MSNKILERSNWPSFKNASFLDVLDKVAARSYKKKTTEGYLAALLIYQQLVEEIVRMLIRNSEFLIECRVYPFQINFKKHDEKMFGQLLQDLAACVNFPQKQKLYVNCTKLNRIRILGVHKITQQKNLTEIRKTVKEVKNIYSEIFNLFVQSRDYFRVIFGKLEKENIK